MKCLVLRSVKKGENRPDQYSQFIIPSRMWGLREGKMLKVTMIFGLHPVHSLNARWGPWYVWPGARLWEQSSEHSRQGSCW